MKRTFYRALAIAAAASVLAPLAAAAQTAPAPAAPPSSPFDFAQSWAQFKSDVKNAGPKFMEDTKLRIQRLKFVRRPKTVLTGYEADPGLWTNLTAFYNVLVNRELDVWEEQEGMITFFPDRAAYYDFLDTMIPPMRDRKFERNRLLKYQVHEITPLPDEEGQPKKVRVLMSIGSDDIYRIGKIMVYHQTWIQAPAGWYAGKVETEPATWLERLR